MTYPRVLRALSCGTELLPRVRAGWRSLEQRTASLTPLPSWLTTRRDWNYLHRKIVPLILHRGIVARIVRAPSSNAARFHSLRWVFAV